MIYNTHTHLLAGILNNDPHPFPSHPAHRITTLYNASAYQSSASAAPSSGASELCATPCSNHFSPRLFELQPADFRAWRTTERCNRRGRSFDSVHAAGRNFFVASSQEGRAVVARSEISAVAVEGEPEEAESFSKACKLYGMYLCGMDVVKLWGFAGI